MLLPWTLTTESEPAATAPAAGPGLSSPRRPASLVTCGTLGAVVSRQRYHPYGTVRYVSGSMPTDFGFTGQRRDDTGLMFYNARYYDAALGRFVSADTIVPEPDNPHALNRYSYVLGNPLKYTDPSGHREDDGCLTEGCVVASDNESSNSDYSGDPANSSDEGTTIGPGPTTIVTGGSHIGGGDSFAPDYYSDYIRPQYRGKPLDGGPPDTAWANLPGVAVTLAWIFAPHHTSTDPNFFQSLILRSSSASWTELDSIVFTNRTDSLVAVQDLSISPSHPDGINPTYILNPGITLSPNESGAAYIGQGMRNVTELEIITSVRCWTCEAANAVTYALIIHLPVR